MSGSDDTEITLGTGKMLALFFGLVALCAVFFGMGFKLGKSSAAPLAPAGDASTAAVSSGSGVRPSADKPARDAGASPSPDLAFYKSSRQAEADTPPASSNPAAAANSAPNPAPSSGETAPTDPSLAPPANGYYVQVAAVSKQEDGEALVDALKKKQYPAFSSPGPDKLFHVQVGPFAEVKNAEEMRAKLMSDGYNPILKK